MKEFLSGLATLLLLSIFLVQFTTNQVVHDKLLFVQKDITTSLQEIKQEGCLTPEIKTQLTEQLKEDLHQTNDSGSVITASHEDASNRAYRGTLIEYTITVPIKNIVGAASFLGIENNETTKTYNGYVSSEWVG